MLEPVADDTELHEAVRLGDPELVESALSAGLDPDMVGMYQWCPLHEAASNGDLEVLTLLLKYKADPNKADSLHLSTPLHYAAKEGHTDCLRALVKAGGRYDAGDSEGATPLDLAENRECWEILDRERTRQFLVLSLADAREVIQRSSSRDSLEDAAIESDLKPERALFGRTTPTAWEKIEVTESGLGSSGGKGTGLLQTSFEYNSKLRSLKIRVWQLQDVLMPPAEFSSISRVYVKGYLLPDKKGDTKRKTEELRIEESSKMESTIVTLKRKNAFEGFKAVYLPSTFQFSNPLVYSNICEEAVANRMVHLDVCVRMKYSVRSLPIASFQIPLKEAVRKLRKEKFRLLPCLGHSMPDNVHSSSDPGDFTVTVEGLYANRTLSNPLLQRRTVRVHPGEEHTRAASDIDLKNVRCLSVESIPTASWSESNEGDDNTGGDSNLLQEIKIHRSPGRGSDTDLTVVDIHREDVLPGSPEERDMTVVVKVESPIISDEGHTSVNLGDVSETSFSGPSETGSRTGRKTTEVDIPRILVTTPDGERDHVGTVAIEMRPLMQNNRTEPAGDAGKTDISQAKRTHRAKPGHVIDMRKAETDQSVIETNGSSHKWTKVLPPQDLVFLNRAFESNSEDANENWINRGKRKELSGKSSERRVGKPLENNAKVVTSPEINLAPISEQTRRRQMTRSSPSSSQEHSPTARQKHHHDSPLSMQTQSPTTEGKTRGSRTLSSPKRGSSAEQELTITDSISAMGGFPAMNPLNAASTCTNEEESKISKGSPYFGGELDVDSNHPRRKKSEPVRESGADPKVNFGFISEEATRVPLSPRMTPTSSPSRQASPGSRSSARRVSRTGDGFENAKPKREGSREDIGGSRKGRMPPAVNFELVSEEQGRPHPTSPAGSTRRGMKYTGRRKEAGEDSSRLISEASSKHHQAEGAGRMTPKVNLGFVSGETLGERKSNRSLSASPKCNSSSGESSPVGPMLNSSPSSSPCVTSPDIIRGENSPGSPFLVDIVDETAVFSDQSRKGRYTNQDTLSSGDLPSLLKVRGLSESGTSRNPGRQSERPKVSRSINFNVTPPLTKGIKTTDLVLPVGGLEMSEVAKLKQGGEHPQNGWSKKEQVKEN